MIKVKELMKSQVVTIGPQEAIKYAIDKMNTGRFRRIPVIEKGRLTGIITDRDIRQALNSPVIFHERVYNEYLLKEIKVESCMTPDPITISPGAEIIEAAQLMEMRKIGGLPVVENDSLIGIITLSDLMVFLIEHLKNHSH
ncbi:MAG: CBS domain-containing protein [Deltaproteobacteria bacterium]|nr:CBS domain-containing protein [Deltaproteobacteria bacterium]